MDGSRARAVLGVAEHATADDCRAAFRRRCLATHPDRGGDPDAFADVVHALHTLTASTPIAAARPAMLVGARAGVDCHDSPAVVRRPETPSFADALRVACAQWSSGS